MSFVCPKCSKTYSVDIGVCNWGHQESVFVKPSESFQVEQEKTLLGEDLFKKLEKMDRLSDEVNATVGRLSDDFKSLLFVLEQHKDRLKG